MKEEKRISYQAGITRKPSDFLCQEGELAECINMTSDGEELKVLTPLSMKGAPGKKLLFVHKLPGGGENYIYEIGGLLWCDGNFLPDGSVSSIDSKDITAIGKTLIVKSADSIKYYLWQSSGYKALDSHITPPEILWFAVGRTDFLDVTEDIAGDVLEFKSEKVINVKNQEAYNNLVIGMYSKLQKNAADKKRFIKPFMVRYAVEMYDGSYTAISNPIICYAGVRRNAVAKKTSTGRIQMSAYAFSLQFAAQFDYSAYSDIVKNVVVFASDGVNLYDLTADQKPWATKDDNVTYWADWVSGENYAKEQTSGSNTIHTSEIGFTPLTGRESDNIKKDLMNVSIFYKIAELGLKRDTIGHDNQYYSLDQYIGEKTITNLTSQDRLPQDYYTNSALLTDSLLTYNNRLLLANPSRRMFDGFTFFSAWGGGTSALTYHIYIYVKTNSGEIIVHRETTTKQRIGHFIYYPDPRAYKAVIYQGSTYYGTVKLEEHPGLNGAYYYNGLPVDGTTTIPREVSVPSSAPTVTDNVEALFGHLYVSEVNNPWLFTSRGDITVGNGKILGAAALTQALSQGQFGQYPLIVFCSDGIWALSVDSEGVLTSVTPMSREVALESNPCITQTDGAIFFVSKKGLMVVAGSDVQCVSEQMNGPVCNTGEMAGLAESQLEAGAESRQWAALIDSVSGTATFRDFIESASLRIAYDYTDSRLLLVRSDRSWCWVYNIKDGSFSKMTLPGAVISVVNNYPDYLLQTSDNAKTLYSLYDDVQEETYADRVLGFLLTRPMKLAGPLAVSSLRELKHVGWWSEKYGSCVKMLLLTSDNLFDWYVVQSRFGMAAKYWRMALFVKMQPRERLSGTIIRKEDRRTENLR